MREGFIFYRSFREAISDLQPEDQLKAYNAIFDYALDGIEPEVKGVASAIFKIAKPQIDANNQRYMNGKKGGRPKKHSDEENKPSENQNKPSENQNKPNDDFLKPKEKEKEKDKDKDKDLKEKQTKRKKSVAESRIGKAKYADEVYLTEKEYTAFIEKYGREQTLWMIQKLNDYKQSSGHTYLDDAAAIRSWVIDEYEKRNRNNQPRAQNIIPDANHTEDQDNWLEFYERGWGT